MSASSRILLPTILIFLAVSIAPSQVRGQPDQKAVTIPIKIVLIGLDQVDANYLTWTYGESGNLPTQITNQVLGGNGTGDIFYPQYTVTKASASFKQELDGYLNSIETDLRGPDPWFGHWIQDPTNSDYCDWQNVSVPYVVYNANSVESWLWNHNQELGGFPANGWTIIVSYLPELPSVTWNAVKDFETSAKLPGTPYLVSSTPHYYGIVATDPDLGYQSRYRDFMDAWGGKLGRMWFVDLSAGPVFQSQWDDIPLQVAMGDNNIDPSSAFGQKWLTEYVSDYVSQATANLITPDFVYAPIYRPNYQIDVFVLDNRTAAEKAAVPIQSTINQQAIQTAFDELVPYSKVTVNVNVMNISQGLEQVIEAGYKYTDSWLQGSEFCSPERYGVVDARPVYDYMLSHMSDYETNPYLTPTTLTIPAFTFAFSGQTYFAYTYKWYIGGSSLEGIALDQTALISMNQYEFTRGNQVSPPQPGKGVGFTHLVIHEVGHEFGLEHPHQFGDIGDFVYSPMGYFTGDIHFGQIDKDAIQRAHVDQIYFATQSIISTLSSDSASQVQAKLSSVDAAYSAMNYTDAMQEVLGAYQLAQQLQGSAPMTQAQSSVAAQSSNTTTAMGAPVTMYAVAGVAIGLIAGLGIGVVMFRKRKSGS
jgi:hypothetical protein